MAPLGNITFYADDPARLARFWSAVFGYPETAWEEPLRSELQAAGLTETDLFHRGLAEDPSGVGPRLFFHHATAPKVGPQSAAPGCPEYYYQLRDPEGDEFCLQ